MLGYPGHYQRQEVSLTSFFHCGFRVKELTSHPESRLLSNKSYVAPMSRRRHRLRTLIASTGIGVGTRNTVAERGIPQFSYPAEGITHAKLMSGKTETACDIVGDLEEIHCLGIMEVSHDEHPLKKTAVDSIYCQRHGHDFQASGIIHRLLVLSCKYTPSLLATICKEIASR